MKDRPTSASSGLDQEQLISVRKRLAGGLERSDKNEALEGSAALRAVPAVLWPSRSWLETKITGGLERKRQE
jgi:hypothetical protein